MKTTPARNELSCVCGAPTGQEAYWGHRGNCPWERELVCCCPPDEAGARAADCPACPWSHVIGPEGLGCPWVRAMQSGQPPQRWLHARNLVLDALTAARVDVVMEADHSRFSKMRTDLWSAEQQRGFARHLSERLEAQLFASHMTVDVVIGRVAGYLREERLFW